MLGHGTPAKEIVQPEPQPPHAHGHEPVAVDVEHFVPDRRGHGDGSVREGLAFDGVALARLAALPLDQLAALPLVAGQEVAALHQPEALAERPALETALSARRNPDAVGHCPAGQ